MSTSKDLTPFITKISQGVVRAIDVEGRSTTEVRVVFEGDVHIHTHDEPEILYQLKLLSGRVSRLTKEQQMASQKSQQIKDLLDQMAQQATQEAAQTKAIADVNAKIEAKLTELQSSITNGVKGLTEAEADAAIQSLTDSLAMLAAQRDQQNAQVARLEALGQPVQPEPGSEV